MTRMKMPCLRQRTWFTISLKMKKLVFPFISLILVSFGLSIYSQMLFRVSSFTIENHTLAPFLPAVLFFAILIFFALLLLWQALSRRERRNQKKDPLSSLRENSLVLLPLAVLLLSPWLLEFYLTSGDLRTRLVILGAVAAAAVVLLKLARIRRRRPDFRPLERGLDRFNTMPLRKRLAALFIVSFAVYNLSVLFLVSRGASFSGDEPYYLMTAHSLYQDQDINLANNYENQDYFQFYPREIFPNFRLQAYARFGRKGPDYVYPISQPGISVLMQPYYWLSRQFHGRARIFVLKASLAVWAVLLGIQIYLLARETWRDEKLSLRLWFLYSFSAPVFFYSIHLYPEVPAALFCVAVFRKIRSEKPLSTVEMLFCGFLLSLLIWFGLKYNMIFWPLLIVSVYFLIKFHRVRLRILAFLAFPVISLGLFYGTIHSLYGTFSPVAVYEGVMTPEKVQAFWDTVFRIPVMLRIDSFFDYFLDQRDGLLLYSPIFFFSFLGLIEVFRKSKRDFIVLLFIAFPFLFNYAFFTHRQGYSPQGRVLAPLSWIGIILIGHFLVSNKKNVYRTLFWIFALIGLSFVVILLRNPGFLYQPTTHDVMFRGGALFVHLSNLYVYFPDFLPSFIKINNLGHIPNYVWLALIALFVAGYIVPKKERRKTGRVSLPAWAMLGVGIFFFLFALFPRTVLLFPVRAEYSAGKKAAFYGLNRQIRMRGPGEFRILRDNFVFDFQFTSWRAFEEMKIEFGSPDGTYETELRLFDITLFKGIIEKEIKTLSYDPLPEYKYKNTNLYRVSLRFKNLSGIRTADYPYRLFIHPSY